MALNRRTKPAKVVASVSQLVVDMTISDANKPLVLQHPHVLNDLIIGLLLEEDNARRGQDGADTLQATCVNALENLALSEVGKPVLRAHEGVMAGLRALRNNTTKTLSDAARQSASAALFELDVEARKKAKAKAAALETSHSDGDGDGDDTSAEHVMLSYNWGHQTTIKRINLMLKERGYTVWIDIEKMKGSTVEAMADAVDNSAVVCYGISKAYKESANCRLEAQYAFQQKKDMVPLMMQKGHQPNGWLGMLLGARLWYGFYDSVLETEEAFAGKIEELCRELGERGKAESGGTVGTAEVGVKPGHVTLSCASDAEQLSAMRRINSALQSRGYVTHFDTEQGTEVDPTTMASAIEESSVFVYGMSRAFKDSSACQSMTQYAHQFNTDMVPLKLEADYRPDGWLGLMSGSALYFTFYGSTLKSEEEFGGKMAELCRELGERGKVRAVTDI